MPPSLSTVASLSQSSTSLRPHPYSPSYRVLSPQSWRAPHPAARLTAVSARHRHQQPQRAHRAHSARLGNHAALYRSVYSGRGRSYSAGLPAAPSTPSLSAEPSRGVTPERTTHGVLTRTRSTAAASTPTRMTTTTTAASAVTTPSSVTPPIPNEVEVDDVNPSYTMAGDAVRCMAVVSEQHVIWTAEYDGRIRIRLIPTGRVVRQIDARPDTYVTALQYVAATQHMWVSFEDGYLYVYRVHTRGGTGPMSDSRARSPSTEVSNNATTTTNSGSAQSVASSSEGRRAGRGDASARVPHGMINASVHNNNNSDNNTSNDSDYHDHSHDGTRAVQAPNYTPALVTMFVQHSGPVHCMHALGDSVFTGGADWKVLKWDAAQPGRRFRLFSGHAGGVRCMCSYDGPTGAVLFTGSDDATIRAWNPYLDYLVHGGTHRDSMAATSMSSTHSPAPVRSNNNYNRDTNTNNNTNIGTVQSESNETNQLVAPPTPCLFTFVGHRRSVLALTVVAAMNQLWSGGEDATVRLWDLTTLQCRWVNRRVHRAPVSVLMHLESRVWSGDKHGHLVVWDVRTQSPLQRVTQKMRVGCVHGMVLALQPIEPCTMWRVWSTGSTGVLQSWNVDPTPMVRRTATVGGELCNPPPRAQTPANVTRSSWEEYDAEEETAEDEASLSFANVPRHTPPQARVPRRGAGAHRVTASSSSALPDGYDIHSAHEHDVHDDHNDSEDHDPNEMHTRRHHDAERDSHASVGGSAAAARTVLPTRSSSGQSRRRAETEALRDTVRTLQARIRVLNAKHAAALAAAQRGSLKRSAVLSESDLCVSPVTAPTTPRIGGAADGNNTNNNNSELLHNDVAVMTESHHRVVLPGPHWVNAMQCKPSELYRTLVDEIADACGLPASRLSRVSIRVVDSDAVADPPSAAHRHTAYPRGSEPTKTQLVAEWDVRHLAARPVEPYLQACDFAKTYALHDTVHSRPAVGLDAAHNALRAIHDELRHAAQGMTRRGATAVQSGGQERTRPSASQERWTGGGLQDEECVSWGEHRPWPKQADAETRRLRQMSEGVLRSMTDAMWSANAGRQQPAASRPPSQDCTLAERAWEQRAEERAREHAQEMQTLQAEVQKRRTHDEQQHAREMQKLRADIDRQRQQAEQQHAQAIQKLQAEVAKQRQNAEQHVVQEAEELKRQHAQELQQLQADMLQQQSAQRARADEQHREQLEALRAEAATLRRADDARRQRELARATDAHERLEARVTELARQSCEKDETIRRLTADAERLRVRVAVLTQERAAGLHELLAVPARAEVGRARTPSPVPESLCQRDVGDILDDANQALGCVMGSVELGPSAGLPGRRHGELARRVKALEDMIVMTGSRLVQADATTKTIAIS